MHRRLIALAALAAIVLPAWASAQTVKLDIGDKAPELKVAQWAKGTPVTAFAAGSVYVVECWATWCGPCRQSIPHVTELAHKYAGKATFIGMNVWESRGATPDPGALDKVTKFVADMGDKMDYNVAVDGPDKAMATAWMEAAGERGIPCAFIVGADGAIAWIGHPMEMDAPLAAVIEGKWDAAAFRTERARKKADEEKQQGVQTKIASLVGSGKIREAIAEVDRMVASRGIDPQNGAMMHFQLLCRVSDADASAYARKIGAGLFAREAQALNALAWTMVGDRSPLKKPDYAVAVELATRAANLTKREDPMILDTLGTAQYRAGKRAAAIETQTLAIALAEKQGGAASDLVTELKGRLAQFKKPAPK